MCSWVWMLWVFFLLHCTFAGGLYYFYSLYSSEGRLCMLILAYLHEDLVALFWLYCNFLMFLEEIPKKSIAVIQSGGNKGVDMFFCVRAGKKWTDLGDVIVVEQGL
ncbi:hypothetical protein AMECASPLE_033755 [Ameca splendens]|uniref:Uncharacterized protein n=1 Tax=Ameca splendens TaxID=208324 RepID=A0ABV0YV88_9TELE